MSFLKRLFGSRLDGDALAQSPAKADYAQIDLLMRFADGAPAVESSLQTRWSRVLPRSYQEQIDLFVGAGWLAETADGYRATETAQPFIARYQERLNRAKTQAKDRVHAALAARNAGEALEIRRAYEAGHPLGSADWTGPEPQLSLSSLTRRILYLDHWLLDGYSPETVDWLKLYAAEQHLWGAYWRLPASEIPEHVQRELTMEHLSISDSAYWKAYGLALYVDNQETWQRCKGGDHVRRLEIVAADDEQTCAACRAVHGQQFLVARVPELPHRACTSALGCRCRYEPVLETYEDLDG